MNNGSDSDEELDRNPSPPPELLGNEEALRGDSIVGTAYSKQWVFGTLMKLIQEVEKEVKDEEESEFGVDVDEDLQNDLCKLWDMSMNSLQSLLVNPMLSFLTTTMLVLRVFLWHTESMNVAQFLHEFKAVDILVGVIGKSKAPRVTEICIGILGNMACDTKLCKTMSENERLIELSLLLLSANDPPTLIENTRLLYTSLSDTETGAAWVAGIKATPDTQDHIRFILTSSTNLDLLRNTGELVDALLDRDEELCTSWATQEFVEAVLEGVKQSQSEDLTASRRASVTPQSIPLASFLHVFQLFSTSQEGAKALVRCAEELQAPLLNYLEQVCEYEIVDVANAVNCLSSAISVLHTLYSSSPVVKENLMSSASIQRYLLKILEPLYPLTHRVATGEIGEPIVEGLNLNSSFSEAEAPSDKTGSSEKQQTAASEKKESLAVEAASQASGDEIRMVGEADISRRDGRTPESKDERDEKDKEEKEEVDDQKARLQFLFKVVQGFLAEIVSSYTAELAVMERDGQAEGEDGDGEANPLFLPALRYLDRFCSRVRLIYMLLTLEGVAVETECLVTVLETLVKRFSFHRLVRIIGDFRAGCIHTHSDSFSEGTAPIGPQLPGADDQ